MNGITIAYITNRKEPLTDWFYDSLLKQYNLDFELQLVIVDYWNGEIKEKEIFFYPRPNICVSYVQSLPSWCQGKHKVTTDNYFSATTARNTAAVYAKYEYIAFVDDLSILSPTWLNSVIEGAKNNEVLLGAYRKDKEMIVENGVLISSIQTPEGADVRWNKVRSADKVKVPHNFFYGCSFAMPTEIFLELNGFDHSADYSGYEDALFGLRLKKLGVQCWYDKNMLTIESEEAHFTEGNYFKRVDDEVSEEHYTQVLRNFGLKQSVYPEGTRRDMSHAMLDIVRQCEGYMPRWNYYSLRDLRAKTARRQQITYADMHYPDRHWFYLKKLSDL